MAEKDIIMMNQKELKRLHLIHKVFHREIKQVNVADILSLSPRQIKRIVSRVRKEGDVGIIHKSRGRPSNRRLADEIKEKVIKYYREKYSDFGPLFACEKLAEMDKIKVSDETLRKWLIRSGDWKGGRERKFHRQWRERKHYFGEMVQMDGSHHDWFEGRAEKCVLMEYIDDATSNTFCRFYSYEGTIPAMESFKHYIEKYGIPMSVYLDKHSTYKSPAKPTIEDELNDTKPLSQFERALEELGVEVIHANSPQAKGRIERSFGTLQDRLVKEMRLKGIKSIEEANKFLEEYLPVFNGKFSVRPVEKANLHRAVPRNINLDRILCIKTKRSLRNDFTVAHNKKLYQVEDNIRTKKVIVEDRIDGSIAITHKNKALKFREIPKRPPREHKEPSIFKPRKKYRPPADHPWRNFEFGRKSCRL